MTPADADLLRRLKAEWNPSGTFEAGPRARARRNAQDRAEGCGTPIYVPPPKRRYTAAQLAAKAAYRRARRGI